MARLFLQRQLGDITEAKTNKIQFRRSDQIFIILDNEPPTASLLINAPKKGEFRIREASSLLKFKERLNLLEISEKSYGFVIEGLFIGADAILQVQDYDERRNEIRKIFAEFELFIDKAETRLIIDLDLGPEHRSVKVTVTLSSRFGGDLSRQHVVLRVPGLTLTDIVLETDHEGKVSAEIPTFLTENMEVQAFFEGDGLSLLPSQASRKLLQGDKVQMSGLEAVINSLPKGLVTFGLLTLLGFGVGYWRYRRVKEKLKDS